MGEYSSIPQGTKVIVYLLDGEVISIKAGMTIAGALFLCKKTFADVKNIVVQITTEIV